MFELANMMEPQSGATAKGTDSNLLDIETMLFKLVQREEERFDPERKPPVKEFVLRHIVA